MVAKQSKLSGKVLDPVGLLVSGMSRNVVRSSVVQKMVSTSVFYSSSGSQRCIGPARGSSEGNLDFSVLRPQLFSRTLHSTLHAAHSRFPTEFLETWGRANKIARHLFQRNTESV